MTELEQITKTERLLHAAKGKLVALKQTKWVAENRSTRFDPQAVAQTENEITEHRKTLAKQIVNYYKIEL